MPLLRKSSEKQLRRMRKTIKKSGGDIADRICKDEKRLPNLYWVDNPIDRDIDTYEDNYDLSTESKKDDKKMIKHLKTFEQYECSERIDESNLDLLRVGVNIDTDTIKGIIHKIEGEYVYLETNGEVEKIPMSKIFKAYKKKK